MSYKVEYTEKALKSLKKLDKPVLIVIKAWIDKNLVGTSNPKKTGKGLTSNRSGQWRYRIGNYRIVTDIQGKKLVIVVIDIGHRRCMYNCI